MAPQFTYQKYQIQILFVLVLLNDIQIFPVRIICFAHNTSTSLALSSSTATKSLNMKIFIVVCFYFWYNLFQFRIIYFDRFTVSIVSAS